MNINFAIAIGLVLTHEGGYVDHPKDPGGATNLGITHKTLANYRGISWHDLPKSEVRNLSKEEATAIYKKNYWDRCCGDELPLGLDYALMDFAVNSGASRATRYLQGIVGSKVDGVIGPNTLHAIRSCPADDSIVALCDKRMTFLKNLKTWKVFGRGWARRVDQVEVDALGMRAIDVKAS